MMQRIVLLATALVVTVAATGCMGPCKLRAEGGAGERAARYELFQGVYIHTIEGKQEINRNAIFKFDTATGDAWIYVELVRQDGTIYVGWREVQPLTKLQMVRTEPEAAPAPKPGPETTPEPEAGE